MEMIKILRYEDSIYFANVENFTYSVIKKMEFDTEVILEQLENLTEKLTTDKHMNKVYIYI